MYYAGQFQANCYQVWANMLVNRHKTTFESNIIYSSIQQRNKCTANILLAYMILGGNFIYASCTNSHFNQIKKYLTLNVPHLQLIVFPTVLLYSRQKYDSSCVMQIFWLSVLQTLRLMSKQTKRRLRKTNTCFTVPNPFSEQLQTQNILPASIAAKLTPYLNLNCSLIQCLPVFLNHDSPEQALQSMQKAIQWQNSSLQHQATTTTIPYEKQQVSDQLPNQRKHQTKVDIQKGGPEQYMMDGAERILQDLNIHRFAPASYDYDYSVFPFEPRAAQALPEWQQQQMQFF